MAESDLSSLVIGGAHQLEMWPQEEDDEDENFLAEDLFGPFLDFR